MSIEGMLTLRCDSCALLGGSIGIGNGLCSSDYYADQRRKMMRVALSVGWSEEYIAAGMRNYCPECASKRTGFPKEPMIRITGPESEG